MTESYLHAWLVVRGDGTLRVVKARPRSLTWNEVMFRLQVKIDSSWGKSVGLINLEIPPTVIAIEPDSEAECSGTDEEHGTD